MSHAVNFQMMVITKLQWTCILQSSIL